MKLRAYAKINLSLRVLSKRPDGYHNIESLMQSISLCDLLTLTPSPGGIEVHCDEPSVPQGQGNLAYKAAELFLTGRELKHGVKIGIEKRIPLAAGLAGGSADAAAVLFGLNEMLEEPLTRAELLAVGSRVGADVPFCLTGGTCLVEGRGETVTRQEPWLNKYFILVCPDFPVATKWAYNEFDRLHLEVDPQIKNDLEPVVVSRHEEIADIKDKLLALGCFEAQMSGSGPSVFGMARHKAEAAEIFKKISEDGRRAYLLETVKDGVEVIA